MANDNWSPFYPTIFYPAQESTSLQRKMSSDLQTIVRDLSRIGQSQLQTQIVQVQSRDQDANYQIGVSIDDLRESLGRDLGGLRNELGSLSSQLEWSIGLLHESIVEQTDVLLTIAKQQRIPTELKVSEYLTGAQEMVSQLASSIQSKRFSQNQIEDSFAAIDDRFLEAMEPKPRASLMYAILLARAELYLLVKKDNEALAFLEESLIYAPRDDSFDNSSYSYRLMGRIVFTQGYAAKAWIHLYKAVELSPMYAIAWYDQAQYLAQSCPINGADMATRALRRAIEMNDDFMLLASIEPNFDPIRKEVDALILTIKLEKAADLKRRTEELRKSHLATYDQCLPLIELVRAGYGEIFWEKERLGKELIGRIWQSHPITTQHTEKVVSDTLNLRDRVLACEGLAELQSLSPKVENLSGICYKLLEELRKLKEFWRDLLQRCQNFLEVYPKNIDYQRSSLIEDKWGIDDHERRKPRLSWRARKYSDKNHTDIHVLAESRYISARLGWSRPVISHDVEHELLSVLNWKMEGTICQEKYERCKKMISDMVRQMTELTELIRKFESIDIP